MNNTRFGQNNRPAIEGQDVGSMVEPVLKWNEDRTQLVDTGKTVDRQEEINAAAVGTSVYDVIARGAVGDPDALPYGDVTDMPETLAEAKETVDAYQAAAASPTATAGDQKPAEASAPSAEGEEAAASSSPDGDQLAAIKAQLDSKQAKLDALKAQLKEI